MRYRFKRGSTELEVEFSADAPTEQQQLVASLLESFVDLLQESAEGAEEEQKSQRGAKKTRRGGPRKAFVSPAIDELLESKWLVQKTTPEVVAHLKTMGVVAANEDNVSAALLRKLQARKLARMERDGQWVWTVHTTA